MRVDALYMSLILFTVSTNAAAQIMLKRGMMQLGPIGTGPESLVVTMFSVVFHPWIFLGLSTFVISMASHLFVLSRVDLSFAFPFLSLAYVLVTAYAFFAFGEDVGLLRVAGIALICGGTLLISMS